MFAAWPTIPANPDRFLLGTSAGQMFESQDGGNSWAPFAHLGPGDDYVLDHIIFDPAHPATLYVAGVEPVQRR